jgi:hypothetical protein
MNNMPWWMASWALLIILVLNLVVNLWKLAAKWGLV